MTLSTLPDRPARTAAPDAGARARRAVGPARRLLHVDGDVRHASVGLDLLRSDDGGIHYRPVARAWRTQARRALAITPLAARLLRGGIHHLTPLPDGGHVAVVKGAVLHRGPEDACFSVAHTVTRGSRPLNVCDDGSGRLWFGEYFKNPARDEVHVYASEDGRSWDVAWTFPAGAIRHVHGVVHDPFRGGLWVLTGDEGDEAGLWWTADGMRTLEPVVRGTQSARAVTVLPTPDGVIVPMDTEHEQNHVQHLDPATGRLERLCPTPGGVFSAGRSATHLALATAVEVSDVNRDPRVTLLVSRDGHDWHAADRLERDLDVLRRARLPLLDQALQYPMLHFPSGVAPAGELVATGQGLRGLHGREVTWRLEVPLASSAARRYVG